MLFGGGIVNVYTIPGGGWYWRENIFSLCDIEGLYRSSQMMLVNDADDRIHKVICCSCT